MEILVMFLPPAKAFFPSKIHKYKKVVEFYLLERRKLKLYLIRYPTFTYVIIPIHFTTDSPIIKKKPYIDFKFM
jgi:hypothetical protein